MERSGGVTVSVAGPLARTLPNETRRACRGGLRPACARLVIVGVTVTGVGVGHRVGVGVFGRLTR